MTLWMVRAGRHGESEEFALANNVATIEWPELGDLSNLGNRDALLRFMEPTYPEKRHETLRNWVSQVWPFVREMQEGDL